jgi:hypothetical protein
VNYIEEITDQACVVTFPRDFPLKDLFDFAASRNWRIVWRRQPDMTRRENPRLYDAVPASQYKMAKELFEPKREEPGEARGQADKGGEPE